ncbi:hypothetical protein GJ744_012007 [Endocarpon pusillum]|uniref:Uncharacterized protein n=1 Tax=Endocarpon pusillum TaxID=364733 RepID=A0A8H7E752_9EURO|nr:hypothetical protein GJ744_012007 [Endocarpon pusillum]
MLCNAGADLKAQMAQLSSPLQSATFCGQKEAVRKLLSPGAKANEDDPYYRPGGTVGSSVQGAAMGGDIDLVQLLVNEGADINCNDGLAWYCSPGSAGGGQARDGDVLD